MKRFQFIFSIVLSIVLIVGALWFRLSNTTTQKLDLAIVSDEDRDISNKILAEKISSVDLSAGTSTNRQLNQTDLISRALFSDYIDLVSTKQNSTKNITALAERYSNAINDSSIYTYDIKISELKVVADSNDSFIKYSNSISTMKKDYAILMSKLENQIQFKDVNDPKFKEFMIAISDIYDKAAKSLLNLEVPNALASNHAELVNNYLSSREASRAIAQIIENPISAYAALNTQTQNGTDEARLLSNIRIALISKGLYQSTSNL